MKYANAVLWERATGETRVSASPETVKKFIALRATLAVETREGITASISDDEYRAPDAKVTDNAVQSADIVLGVQAPEPEQLAGAKFGAWIVAGLDPFSNRTRVDAYERV
jgi:NAD(P) transhydrogenase subunit alpha